MVGGIFSAIVKTLFIGRFLGVPVFFWIVGLLFILNGLIHISRQSRSGNPRSSAHSGSSYAANAGWLSTHRTPRLFIEGAIKLGMVGWILLGTVILLLASLDALTDLARSAFYGDELTPRIITSNIAPAAYGILLLGFGAGILWFFRVHLEGDNALIHYRSKFLLLSSSVFSAFLFVISNLRSFHLGWSILFLLIALVPALYRFALPRVKTAAGKGALSDAEEEGNMRNPKW
jgi:hypothetical protein